MRGKLYTELDPSGRTVCSGCGIKLTKGTYRLVEKIGSGKWVKISRFCPTCGLLFLKDCLGNIGLMVNQLRSVL